MGNPYDWMNEWMDECRGDWVDDWMNTINELTAGQAEDDKRQRW